MTCRYARPALFVLPIIAGALWAWSGPEAASAPKPTPAPEPPTARLFKPRPFRGLADPETQLGEVMTYVGAVYEVKLDVNEEAFRDRGFDDVRKRAVGELPAMGGASLDRVLRKVLGRLPVESGAVYMVRADHVEITTRAAQKDEVWGNYPGPYLPLVHADFEGRTLAEALRELSEQSGTSIVVDARAADKAKSAVSASFTNLPLDTAVRILTDMAGLKSALNDNVIYVSSEERNVAARPNANLLGGGTALIGANGMALTPAQAGLFAPARWSADFEKRPIQEALQELLKPTGMKLVVDTARVGDKSKLPVTANLEGATVETAVRLLADMANLRPVIYDNIVYLTTKDNAVSFIKASQSDLHNPGAGLGALGGVGGLGGGLAGLGGGLAGLGGGIPASPR
ncbi:MAG TPA: hypothetical protein VKA46_02745 [Gemmataceae bacterium]|nr:hypothetical protein [Gemmataceae bacterium]